MPASVSQHPGSTPNSGWLARSRRSPWRKSLARLLADPRVWFGLGILSTSIALALLAPLISPTDPDALVTEMRLQGPSGAAWLGFDANGGSMATALFYGARTSLYIGFLTVLISITFGTSIGLIAGYRRGWVDMLLMRGVDLLMAFPGILLAMALAALMGPNLHNVVFAIAATGWTASARLVRGQVLTLTEREYVVASRALGATDLRLIIHHIFPGTLSPLVVLSTFSLSGVIIVEASLSFLGLGAQDGAPSWGAILAQGRQFLEDAPHISVIPGIAIFAIVLALNFLGDALRDVLDPRHNQQA